MSVKKSGDSFDDSPYSEWSYGKKTNSYGYKYGSSSKVESHFASSDEIKNINSGYKFRTAESFLANLDKKKSNTYGYRKLQGWTKSKSQEIWYREK